MAVALHAMAAPIALTLSLTLAPLPRAAAEVVVVTPGDGALEQPGLPPLPHNFRANVTVVAHLVDRRTDHPPWLRVVELWYDFRVGGGGRARSDVRAGLEAGKTFLRRWDTRDEYCHRGDAYAECRRGFLSA